jgi:hypothetical protein
MPPFFLYSDSRTGGAQLMSRRVVTEVKILTRNDFSVCFVVSMTTGLIYSSTATDPSTIFVRAPARACVCERERDWEIPLC